ncbi:glyoxylate/hydroxypyruvate reductase A [Palleronia sp. LCG004]|uniref:2-hydroxyacid dehydrogenase n=1 Tax=Palleronia sp. LCG004 TaxID=3079304 RepID=UPI00294276D0|nr:glyoxylate/hydroxypyruvate reductase A [Palleronia sp. LCG004]WOI58110.1 glyoxylate/hydroxypyruvate reductase A [Palleronia sp. LCG004]
MALLFLSTPARIPVWRPLFDAAGETLIESEDAVCDPAEVTAIACWQPPEDLSRYPNLRAVISVGAGVDHLPPLPQGVALSRTLAPGIEAMVRDWVVMASLMLHRDMPTYLEQARAGEWRGHPVPLAASRRIGILGMGRIGTLAAESLAALGFEVAGLSRSGKAGVVPMFAAQDFKAFLERSDMLVCLLPLTPETRGILNDETLSALPMGAKLVQAGRGAHLDAEALRRALDAGRISAAMLDVTDPEPLPADHWMWSDPRLIVTPHVAAETDAAEGGRHAVSVMTALRHGAPIPGLVDQSRGY